MITVLIPLLPGTQQTCFFSEQCCSMGTLAVEGAEAVNMLGGKFKVHSKLLVTAHSVKLCALVISTTIEILTTIIVISKVLTSTDQIKELQTIIRDKDTSRSDFKFVADRLIRMVIEEGLNQLPYQVLKMESKGMMVRKVLFQECEITTPTGCQYSGLKYEKGNCGVSIVRLSSYKLVVVFLFCSSL